jgi:hypothetical protein
MANRLLWPTLKYVVGESAADAQASYQRRMSNLLAGSS